ncbi:MAG: hypothetical protein OHK0022_52290 [Roseiflexaceae bacterium]
MFDWLDRQNPRQGLMLGVCLALAVAAFDLLVGPGLDLAVLYTVPILLIAWFGGHKAGWMALLLATGFHAGIDLSRCASPTSCIAPLCETLLSALISGLLVKFIVRLRSTLVVECTRARCDPLTGLSNRLGFYEQAEREMRVKPSAGECLTVLYIDCDGFKAVNDTYGHQGGDQVLRMVGQALRGAVRSADIAARVGGDEFVLLLRVEQAALVQPLVGRIAAALNTAMEADSWPVTFSIGAVTFTSRPSSVDMLLASADALMYRIKEQGKDGIAYAVVSQHQEGDTVLVLQASDGDVPAMYQPPAVAVGTPATAAPSRKAARKPRHKSTAPARRRAAISDRIQSINIVDPSQKA